MIISTLACLTLRKFEFFWGWKLVIFILSFERRLKNIDSSFWTAYHRLFDETYKSEVPKCTCCYVCMKLHSDNGCIQCTSFLDTYIPQKSTLKVNKSVALDLTEGLKELFRALRIDYVLVENQFKVKINNFIKDFIREAVKI